MTNRKISPVGSSWTWLSFRKPSQSTVINISVGNYAVVAFYEVWRTRQDIEEMDRRVSEFVVDPVNEAAMGSLSQVVRTYQSAAPTCSAAAERP